MTDLSYDNPAKFARGGQPVVAALGGGRPPEEERRFRPIRCLLTSRPRPLPSIDGIEYVLDAEENFDVIILTNSRDQGAIEELMARSSNPAAPIVTFSPDVGPRADAVVSRPTTADLASAVASLQPLIKRLAALPEIPVGIDRYGLLALALAYSRNLPLEAQWQAASADAIGYPLLLGMPNARSVLEEMAEAGLLRRRFFERLHICGHCDSSQIHAREVCSFCRASNLAEQALIHHYACGQQAGQSEFEHRDGYVCPKCHRLLRHYGVDYDKPGTLITCGACGKTMSEPSVGFICANCGGRTPAEQARTRDWFSYDVLPDGLAALRAGQLPRMSIVQPKLGRHSLRDFRLIVENNLRLAQKNGRPLTVWRIAFDDVGLSRAAHGRGFDDLSEFIREIIIENMRDGDVVAALPNGLVVCLNDIDSSANAELQKRIHHQVRKIVKAKVEMNTEVYQGEQIAPLLRELDQC